MFPAETLELISSESKTKVSAGNIIGEYMTKHFGIKIIMDEEKIITDNKYDLDLVYKEIDRLAEFAGMKKIDKYNYISKNDSPSELGCFAWANLKKHDWFTNNVKEWLWLDKEDGILDIIEFIKNRNYK